MDLMERSPYHQDGSIILELTEQNIIMSAYFYGLALGQYPGGRLAEKQSAKAVILCGTILAAIMCLVTPAAAYNGFYFMFAVMFLKGIGQGVMAPAFSILSGNWFCIDERSTLIAVCISGMPLGGFVVLITSGYMSQDQTLNWSSVFYLWGVVGLIFCFLFWWFVHDTPMEHPNISQKELFRIMSLRTMDAARLKKKPRTPIVKILTSTAVWAFFFSGFASFWVISLYNIFLPMYLGKVLEYGLAENGLMASIPQVMQAIFMLTSSFICTTLENHQLVSKTTLRKVCNGIGLLGMVCCMIATGLVHCNRTYAVVLFSLAFGLSGLSFHAVILMPIELAPRFAGTISGLMSIVGSLSGVIIPMILVILTGDRQPSLKDWNTIFFITAGISLFSVIFFTIFGTSNVQSWNYPENILKSPSSNSIHEIDDYDDE